MGSFFPDTAASISINFVQLKKDRLKLLQQESTFHFEPINLADEATH